MEQTPDIFRRGKVAYEALIEELYKLYLKLPLKARKDIFNDKSKKLNDSKDATGFKNMVKDFNCVLQYSLLDIGTNGEKVSYLEMLYIADFGDLDGCIRLDHYLQSTIKKSDKKFKNTYLMLPDATPEEVLYIKTCIYEYVEPIRNRLMKAFAIASKLGKINIPEELLMKFAEIYEPFLRVDNRFDHEDPSIAVNEFKEIFFNHISDYKSKIKSYIK